MNRTIKLSALYVFVALCAAVGRGGETDVSTESFNIRDRDGGHGMLFCTLEGQLTLTLHQPNKAPLERMRLFPIDDDGETLRLGGSEGSEGQQL